MSRMRSLQASKKPVLYHFCIERSSCFSIPLCPFEDTHESGCGPLLSLFYSFEKHNIGFGKESHRFIVQFVVDFQADERIEKRCVDIVDEHDLKSGWVGANLAQ